ncbi:protein-cysteine N-palmitoyltransferase HHAT isoform X1 [Paramormyrops kingsleyae]|uniref:protein-cysteine N-palmitoyltransferase HHAT isoform X1 n=1 Tax=Paramormyrops kingsleyae TaxID=1676925 RepID=UPI003B9728F8
MAPQRTASPAPLPRWEMSLYWLLSLGSHFYSFFELHKFSKEYEERIGREFELEGGFLIWGFKKDPTDFEWSFWSEWAKKSLLWSFLGHAVISRLSGLFAPRARVAVLTAYGLVAACHLLGIRGLAVVLLHMAVSFSVAQLRKPALCWASALMLLSTLHLDFLGELQRGWYETEAEYYLLLFSVAVCSLRSISYSLDHCCRPLVVGRPSDFFWLTAYTFYHPLFYNGPIISFQDFSQHMQGTSGGDTSPKLGLLPLLRSAGRILAWWLLAETLVHLMYMHAIQNNETYLQILPPWALGGLALALVQFFYVKYLVLFGLPALLARLDGLEPPPLPRCVSTMYSFTGMWRHFDVGLYRWLLRYIYLPLGGSRKGRLRMALSTSLAFAFVCFWHGGHDYLRNWALMNWASVTVEAAARALLSSSYASMVVQHCLSPPMRRRAQAFLSAFSTAMLILSNLVFLGGNHVGKIFWKRVFIHARTASCDSSPCQMVMAPAKFWTCLPAPRLRPPPSCLE